MPAAAAVVAAVVELSGAAAVIGAAVEGVVGAGIIADVATGAIIGAGSGAISSAVQGGDIAEGALVGAVTRGVGAGVSDVVGQALGGTASATGGVTGATVGGSETLGGALQKGISGAVSGGLGAGLRGGDIGQGILTGGLSGAVSGAAQPNFGADVSKVLGGATSALLGQAFAPSAPSQKTYAPSLAAAAQPTIAGQTTSTTASTAPLGGALLASPTLGYTPGSSFLGGTDSSKPSQNVWNQASLKEGAQVGPSSDGSQAQSS
jgi:hypothetical protein